MTKTTILTQAVVAVAMLTAIAFSQSPSKEQLRHKQVIDRALATRGEIVAKGSNTRPTGKLAATTWSLERVPLKETVTVGPKTANAIYRLVIRGQSLGDCASCLVWISGKAEPAYPRGKDELVVAFIGQPAFPPDAVISVTKGRGTCNVAAESVLPERLTLPPEFHAAPRPANRVQATSVRSVPQFGGGAGITLTVQLDEPVHARNSPLMLQIGTHEFPAAPLRTPLYAVQAVIPEQQYWRLPDTGTLVVKYGTCVPGGIASFPFNKYAVRSAP